MIDNPDEQQVHDLINEGDKLHFNGIYADAKSKYQQAFDITKDKVLKMVLKVLIDKL